MGSERTSRRELLKGGAALAGGVTLGELAASQAQAHDHPPTVAAGEWLKNRRVKPLGAPPSGRQADAAATSSAAPSA